MVVTGNEGCAGRDSACGGVVRSPLCSWEGTREGWPDRAFLATLHQHTTVSLGTERKQQQPTNTAIK